MINKGRYDERHTTAEAEHLAAEYYDSSLIYVPDLDGHEKNVEIFWHL